MAMNFWVGPVSRVCHQREILARFPFSVGRHRVAPVLKAAAEVVAAGEGAAGAAQHDDLDGGVAFGEADRVSISSGIGGTMVLRCSGRFRVTVATGGSVLYSSVSNCGGFVGIAAVESI